MNLTTLSPIMLIIIVGVVLAIGLAPWMYMRKKLTEALIFRLTPRALRRAGCGGTRLITATISLGGLLEVPLL